MYEAILGKSIVGRYDDRDLWNEVLSGIMENREEPMKKEEEEE